jgi:hypothetical protein
VTFAVCTGVVLGCLGFSWRLARFLKACDERHELVVMDAQSYMVVKEAERIVKEAAEA